MPRLREPQSEGRHSLALREPQSEGRHSLALRKPQSEGRHSPTSGSPSLRGDTARSSGSPSLKIVSRPKLCSEQVTGLPLPPSPLEVGGQPGRPGVVLTL